MEKKGYCIVEFNGNRSKLVLKMINNLVKINDLNDYVESVELCRGRFNYIVINMFENDKVIKLIKGIKDVKDFLRSDNEVVFLSKDEIINLI